MFLVCRPKHITPRTNTLRNHLKYFLVFDVLAIPLF